MTREEAIMVLKEISATLKSWNGFTEYPQAIDMAIEALSADAVSREDIIGYIGRVRNSGLGRNKALEYIRKYVERTESTEPSKVDFRTDKSANIGTEVNDLISRADAIEAVQDHFNADGFRGYVDGQKMMDRINALPTADAVQIVRCKDCKHQKFYYKDTESFFCNETGMFNMHIDDGDGEFWCRYGERKEL